MRANFNEFSVWAPNAKNVRILVGASALSMNRAPDGWWRIAMEPAEQQIRYRFSLDDGPGLPDPCSCWQPCGVHGDSFIITKRETKKRRIFKAADLKEAVFYELHVGTFTKEGTYRAAQKKLRYLSELGVTHIEMMPLATFPGEHGWGYDGVALYAPHSAYGTPQDLGAFVEACHTRGIAVILDVVYNHFGPDGNYLPQYGPYFNELRKTPWGASLNFDDAGSDEVRNFLIQNALMWLRDYGFDGLRLDAVHAIEDNSAIHFLEELATKVGELGGREQKDFLLVAESDKNDPRLVQSPEIGGYGLDAHWIDDFHHALHAFFTQERNGYYEDFGSLEQIAKALRQGYVYDGQYSQHRKRRHGRPPKGISPQQLVIFSQNHDQIGNRGYGERLSMMLDSKKLKAIAAMIFLSPFSPMIFQGEEWGAHTPFLYFTDHTDKELGKLVTKGRQKEFAAFGWKKVPDPQAVETFQKSKLDWTEIKDKAHADILKWYKKLIQLRKLPGRVGHHSEDVKVSFDEAKGWLILQNGKILGLFNLSDTAQKVELPEGDWKVEMGEFSPNQTLPAWATVVLSQKAL